MNTNSFGVSEAAIAHISGTMTITKRDEQQDVDDDLICRREQLTAPPLPSSLVADLLGIDLMDSCHRLASPSEQSRLAAIRA